MDTKNLIQETQRRIDALEGNEDIKYLLTLKAATEVDSSKFNTTKLDGLISSSDSSIGSQTTSTDLVAHARAVNRYPMVEKLIQGQGGIVNQYPYDFITGEKEAVKGFCGQGGSTWWVRPTTVGRSEEGRDVIYSGVVYEGSEDKSSPELYKQKGEAVIAVKRLSVETDPYSISDPYITWRERALNQNKYSYLCDEHHQPCTFLNKQLGQLIFGWGSRNTVNPSSARELQNICYGKTLETLSSCETPRFESTANYVQMVGTGNTVYAFSRVNIHQWNYSRGTGGQNFSPTNQPFMSAGYGNQYYLNMTWVDADEMGLSGTGKDRSILHCFGQAHPTNSPDGKLRYLKGQMVLAGDQDSEFSRAGIYFTRPTTGDKAKGSGRLGEMEALSQGDFETAYTCPSGRSYRLLDVQYGVTPRALIAEFTFDWEHGKTVPFGKTYDIKIVQFNEWTNSWDVIPIKNNVRGACGYKPWRSADVEGTPVEPYERGVESYTSFYIYGACFHRGRNGLDTLPKLYLAHRIGDDMNKNRLTEIHLSDDYSSVEKEVDLTPLILPDSMVDMNRVTDGVPAYANGIEGSRNFIYRPDTVLYGNKRGVMVDVAHGWSNYGSFSSERALVLREEEAGSPLITTYPTTVEIPEGGNVEVGLTAVSPGGSKLTYEWEYQNSGSSQWSAASSQEYSFLLHGSSSSNGRKYRCRVTNSVGTTVSPTITISVS